MDASRQRVVHWVASEVLPHEAAVRRWLYRHTTLTEEIEDIVQECYFRIARLGDVSHIRSGRAYLFTAARNVLIEHLRRARVVRIESLSDVTEEWSSEEVGPERIAGARRELERVRGMLERLPERTRRIIEMRKIQGLSQREIAKALGISETIVENEVSRGVRRLRKMLAECEVIDGRVAEIEKSNERSRNRSSD